MNSETLEEILQSFGIDRIEKITDLKNKQGWSSKFLFKIKTKDKKYLLKGKSSDQLNGIDRAIKVANFLLEKNIKVRKPIKNKKGNYLLKKESLEWLLTTYIEGATFETAKLTEKTFESLAIVMVNYLPLTMGKKEIVEKLNVPKIGFEEILNKKEQIKQYNQVLKSTLEKEIKLFELFLQNFNESLNSNKFSNLKCALIHNDISNKNLVVNTDTKKVKAVIDWDHAIYTYAIKEVIYALKLAEKYPKSKKEKCRKIFLSTLKQKIQINYELIDTLYFVYKTNFIWNTIFFHANLIKELGNTTGEEEKFREIIKQEGKQWMEFSKDYS